MLRPATSVRLRVAAHAAAAGWLLVCGCDRGGPPSTPPADDPIADLRAGGPADPVTDAGRAAAKGDVAGALALLDDALARAETAPADGPRVEELLFARGVILRDAGRDAEAEAAWTAALARSPQYVPALGALGALAVARGDWDGAITRLSELLRLQPEFADGHYNLSVALAAKGRAAEARAALAEAAKLAPRDPFVLLELARNAFADGDPQRALELGERAVVEAASDPTSHASISADWGSTLAAQGRYPAAEVALQRALELRPDDAEIRLQLARAHLRMGKTAEAAAGFAALAEIFPEEAVVFSDWGAALAKGGDPAQALPKLDRALELDPALASAHVRKVGALVALARCPEAKAARARAPAAAHAAIDAALQACAR